MTRSPNARFDSPEGRLESFWLPPDTIGNGIDACRWAEIIVVSRGHATQLLEAFRVAGVPARAAAVHHPVGSQDTRMWVDPDRYAAAEDVLLHELSR
jgi:hypothetical protein